MSGTSPEKGLNKMIHLKSGPPKTVIPGRKGKIKLRNSRFGKEKLGNILSAKITNSSDACASCGVLFALSGVSHSRSPIVCPSFDIL